MRKLSTSDECISSPNSSVSRTKLPISSPFLYTKRVGKPLTACKKISSSLSCSQKCNNKAVYRTINITLVTLAFYCSVYWLFMLSVHDLQSWRHYITTRAQCFNHSIQNVSYIWPQHRDVATSFSCTYYASFVALTRANITRNPVYNYCNLKTATSQTPEVVFTKLDLKSQTS